MSLSELAVLPKNGPHNWTEAFTHFCSGLPLLDIAQMMEIPLEKLEMRHRNERWPMMRAKVEAQMQSLAPVHPDDIAKRAAIVQQNRDENYRLWDASRKITADLLQRIVETEGGKGIFKRYYHNKGAVVEHDGDMSVGDWATIMNALQTIAQGTYAALGDRISGSGAKDDPAAMNSGGAPTIQIILPEFIARPRAEREVKEAKATPIDV